jgi:hypothetical protein
VRRSKSNGVLSPTSPCVTDPAQSTTLSAAHC